MKKIIITILSAIIVLSSLSTLLIFAFDSGEYTQDSILVDFRGDEVYLDVFVSEYGTILVPADILTFFGGLKRITDGYEYVYSESGSRYDDYLERKIYISMDGSHGKSVVQIPNKGSLSGVDVNFSDYYIYDEDLYLPLEEIVPFLDAKIEITTDGVLHIYLNPVSIFEAIRFGSLYDLLDPDYANSTYNVLFDLSDGNGLWCTSLFVDSIVNGKLFGRIDWFKSGQIKDYKAIFEKLLRENETYLSAFNEEETPLDNVFADMNEYISEGNKFVKIVDGVLGKTETILKYAVGSDKFKNYQEFSTDIDSFGDISLIVDSVYDIVDCADVIMKMADDNYEMLDVVYGRGDLKNTVAGTAAKETIEYYSGDYKKALKTVGVSTLRDFLSKTVNKPAQEAIKPFTVVFEAFSAIPGMDDLSRDYDVYYVDIIVSNSREAFVDYYNNMTFDSESLNDIRLSLLMTMVASKYGYDISSMFPVTENPDDIQYGSIRNNHRLKINAWIEQLYLAADSAECCTPEYYSEIKKELSERDQYLQLYGIIIPDVPEASEPTEDLEFTLNDDGKSYSVTGIGTCTDMDIVIPNTYNDLPVTHIRHQAFDIWDSFRSITIGSSVTCIEYRAFSDCINLVSVKVDPDNKNYKSVNGNLYSKDGKTLVLYAGGKKGTSFIIPNGVTYIARGSLDTCPSLISITIPKSVTDIESYAFYMYSATFDNVYYEGDIEDWLKIRIGYSGNIPMDEETKFYFGNKLVTEVVIPDGITSIGSYAFRSWKFLQNIDIPDSVTSIEIGAFPESSSIKYTEYNNAYFLGNKNNPYHTLFRIKDNSIASFTIPSKTKVIYGGAFADCTSLANITIPNSVTSIGRYAFARCTSLTTATFENTSGWWCKYILYETDEPKRTNISSSDLAVPTSAAACLVGLYEYYWQCDK